MDSASPNFERYLAACRREEPDRVPVAEVGIDPEVKDAVLGHPVLTVQEQHI